ncbi:C10-like protein [Mya arenaria]|uniref:Protein C10 n=1 Tax=Mya arenaria TaxID=6604 RepID=A0ABY7GC92_MYAAR|nr:C10-like protein [Mya arenaria]
MAASLQHFSLHECKVALQDILRAFREPDNVSRLDEARENAGNDMLRAMQTVFPVASQIQMEAVKVYEKQDPDVAQMNSQLRSILIPPVRAQGMVSNGS